MPETPPIPPALSAEHWALIGSAPRVVNGQAPVVFTGGLREPGVPGVRGLAVDPKTEPHALTAALNATLPDGHAGKITREDVEAVLDAEPIGSESYRGYDGAAEDRLRALAAKLAVLLPPAPEGPK